MASFQKVILLGHLTRDVELKYTPNETAVAEVGVAVNERVKKGEEWVDEPVFVDVTVWGRTAEILSEYATKGSNVLFEGRLKLDQWEDGDGNKRQKLRVVAQTIKLLGQKPE